MAGTFLNFYIDDAASTALPEVTIAPRQPLLVDLAADAIVDAGGILSLLDAQGLKVGGVSYLGGGESV